MAIRQLAPEPEDELARAAREIVDIEARLSQARLRYQALLVEHAIRLAKQEQAPMVQLLSVAHAAKLVDVDQSTVWRAVGDGSLPSRVIGRSRRIAVSDLSRWGQAQA